MATLLNACPGGDKRSGRPRPPYTPPCWWQGCLSSPRAQPGRPQDCWESARRHPARTRQEPTDWSREKGARQGCVLSPAYLTRMQSQGCVLSKTTKSFRYDLNQTLLLFAYNCFIVAFALSTNSPYPDAFPWVINSYSKYSFNMSRNCSTTGVVPHVPLTLE